MLSARLAEGKLRIVDSEVISQPKTKIVDAILKGLDERSRIVLITGYAQDANFLRACKNI